MYGLLRVRHSLSQEQRYSTRADMCALCDALHASYGISGRALTSYDAIFLATLTAAQNPALRETQPPPLPGVCTRFLHAPAYTVAPRFTFSAAVSVLLAALRVEDNSVDGKRSPAKQMQALWVRPRVIKATRDLQRIGFGDLVAQLDPTEATRRQKEVEAKPDATLDSLSAITAEWLGEIVAATARLADRSANTSALRQLGTTLGRLIYIHDALEDISDDVAHNEFNALLDAAPYRTEEPRATRISRAQAEGKRLLDAGRTQLKRDMAAVTIVDNSALVKAMLFDSRLLDGVQPREAKAELRRLPVITRAQSKAAAHACTHRRNTQGKVAALVAAALMVLPLQAECCECIECCDGCECCGECCVSCSEGCGERGKSATEAGSATEVASESAEWPRPSSTEGHPYGTPVNQQPFGNTEQPLPGQQPGNQPYYGQQPFGNQPQYGQQPGYPPNPYEPQMPPPGGGQYPAPPAPKQPEAAPSEFDEPSEGVF